MRIALIGAMLLASACTAGEEEAAATDTAEPVASHDGHEAPEQHEAEEHEDESWSEGHHAMMVLIEHFGTMSEDGYEAEFFTPGSEPDIFEGYAPVTVTDVHADDGTISDTGGVRFATVPIRVSFTQDMEDGEPVTLDGTITLRQIADFDTAEGPVWAYESAEMAPYE